MTRTEPQLQDGARYSVMEACRELECSRKTFWKYVDYFRVRPALNCVNGRQYFTGKQLRQMWRCIL